MLGELLKRLPADAGDARNLVTDALGIPENLKTKVATIRSDPDLNEQAKVRRIKALALGSPSEHLQQLQGRADAMKADVQNLRLALAPKADRADLFAADQRDKVLSFGRSLPQHELLRYAMEDQVYAEAILLAPHPTMTGLSREQLELVKAAYVERNFGPQLAGITAREKVLEVVNAALEIATNAFRREAGLNEMDIAA